MASTSRLVGTFLLLALPVLVSARPPLELLVASTDPASIGTATNIGNVQTPVVNERGDFVFIGSTPQGAPGAFLHALFAWRGGAITPLAWDGQPYPGQTEVFYHLPPSDYSFSDAGTALFLQSVGGRRFPWPENVPQGEAVWLSSGGQRLLIASRYSSAPGLETDPAMGQLYFDFFSELRWNNNDFYVFRGTVQGFRRYGNVYYGGKGGSLAVLHANNSSNVTLFPPKLARDVDVAWFEGSARPQDETQTTFDSLYRSIGSGKAKQILAPMAPLPGRPQGAEQIILWAVDELGNALFEGRQPNLADQSYGFWEETIFGEGTRRVIAFNEEIETKEGSLTILGYLSPYSVLAVPRHSGGHTAFMGTFRGLGGSGMGLFKIDRDDEIRLVFNSGATAPGTEYIFTDRALYVWYNFALNAHGLTAFYATFKGGDAGAEAEGLWIVDTGGVPHLVLRKGETLMVRGQTRTADGIEFDGETALTDSGILVFRVIFKEGGSAIYRTAAPGAAELQSYLRGEVRSALPTTRDDYAVDRATLTVYEQPEGRIRDKRDNESDGEYNEFVQARIGRPVKKLQITEANDGGFFIPGLNALKPSNEGVVRHAFYAIEVTGGETQEWASEGGMIDTNRTVPLHFLSKRVINFALPTVDAVIELQPLDEIGTKQSLADNLSEVAPVNWKPIEDEVDAYLDQLRANIGSLTETNREALRRGIWAERAFVQAADFSEELIKAALKSLGTVLADAFSEFMRSESDALKGAKKRVQKADDIRASPEFRTGQLNNEAAHAASAADQELVNGAEFAAILSNLFKVGKPVIVKSLVESGTPPDRAEKIANNLVLLLRSLLNAVKDAGMDGMQRGWAASTLLLQELVKAMIDEAYPAFFDGNPELGFSFATITAPHLQQSVTWMKGWNTQDEEAFLLDRGAFLRRMDEFIYDQGVWIDTTARAQIGGEYFSNVESAMAVLATGVKWVKAVEKAAKALKYLSNLEGVVIPMVVVFSHTPDEVEALTYRAFGQELPPRLRSFSTTSTAEVSPANAPAVIAAPLPNAAPVQSALDQIAGALLENDIGSAVRASVDLGLSESLARVYSVWKTEFRRFEAGARSIAAVSTTPNLTDELNRLLNLRVSQMTEEARLGAELGELFAGVLSGAFASASAAEYVAERTDVLTAIEKFERALARTTRQLNAVRDALASAQLAAPALPVVVLEAEPVLSSGVAARTITQENQVFTMTATAYNPGATAFPGLAVELTAQGLGAVITTPVRDIPSLAPGARATLEWAVNVTNASSGAGLALSADFRAAQGVPAGAILLGAEWLLHVDPALADADLDGLPTTYELARNLNTNLDDAAADPDADALSNLQEYELGTDPAKADSDGDDAGDKQDRDPLNAAVTADPAEIASSLEVQTRRVVLTPAAPSAILSLTNRGEGLLLLQAESENPGLLTASPEELIYTTGGSVLIQALAPFPVLGANRSLQTAVTIRNLAGGFPQEERVIVTLALSSDPEMRIQRRGPAVIICWLADAPGYLLEEKASLSGAAPWTPAPAQVQQSGGEACATIPINESRRFYRLRKQ